MKKIILLITVFFYCLRFCNAQSGELDSSFGVNGSVTTNFGSLPGLTQYTCIAVETDGKLVAAGYTQNDNFNNLALARYNIGGSLDKSFGTDGKVTADSFTCTAMAIQKDGKIVVAGSALARYNQDGSIDSTFSSDGKVTSDFSGISAMVIQSDGKILVSDTTRNAKEFSLARYNPDGSPDNTFSGDGKIQTGSVQSILVDSDGKIITVGFSLITDKDHDEFSIILTRYTMDGNLDSSFNRKGIVNYSPGNDWSSLSSAALQNDGKIILAGSRNSDVTLIRFNNNGSIDNSFNNGGQVETPVFSFLQSPLIIESDGKIITGNSYIDDADFDFALTRYNVDGSVDDSFGENGMQVSKISSGFDVVTSVAISGNRLYAAGVADYYVNRTAAITSYMQTGTPDSSFGTNGIVETTFGSGRGSTNYVSTAIQTDGKVVVVGNTNNGSTYDFAIARYNTDGSLDNTFNGDGKQTTNFGIGQSSVVTSVAIQNDGKIVVAGSIGTGINTNENFAVARYNIDGSADTTFDHDGKQITNFGVGESVQANSAAIQNDGKIVVAGYTNEGAADANFAVARYNTDGSPDTSFNGDGKQTTLGLERYSYGYSVAIQSDGKIVLAGTSTENVTDTHMAVARYNTNGSLDKSFSGGIIKSTQLGGTNGFSSVALQADGKILVAGYTNLEISGITRAFFTQYRYNTNGSPDKSFDKDGIKEAFKSDFFGIARSVAIQSDGKIVAAGYVIADNENYPAFASFDADGSLNTNFSGDGMAEGKNGSTGNTNAGMAISKNRLYNVSTTENNFGIVSRYLLDSNTQVPPTVSLTNPGNNATYLSGANVYLAASASDADGTIKKVDFYNGAMLLHTATDTPYTFKWEHVLRGNYTLTAKATDNNELVTTSDSVHISVVANKPPTVSISNPANDQTFLKGATIHLRAAAFDTDGRIIRVEFYNGSSLLTTEYKEPYTFDWRIGRSGNYIITATATDNWGAVTTSAPINISVVPNQPPMVSIISPSNGQVFTAPVTGATINFEASARDTDGRIVQVSFYNDTTLLTNNEHKVPYTYQWQNVPAGTYTITAVAKDNWSAETTSAPITVTVITSPGEPLVSSRPSSAGMKTDLDEEKSMKLLPNPARNILNITTTGLQKNKRSTISVISSSGVIIKTMQTNAFSSPLRGRGLIKLDVSTLATGMYIIKIVSGDKVMYRQFVKM